MQTQARTIQLTTNSPAILQAVYSKGTCVVMKKSFRSLSFKHLLKVQIIVVKTSPDVDRVIVLANHCGQNITWCCSRDYVRVQRACGNSVCAIIAWERHRTICVVSLANNSHGQIPMSILSATRKIFPCRLQYCVCSNVHLNLNLFLDVIHFWQLQFDITCLYLVYSRFSKRMF